MRKHHIYVIESTCGKFLKVGFTSRLEARLAELKASTPYRFRVAYTFEYPSREEAEESEQEFHQLFRSEYGIPNYCFDGGTEWY